MLVSDLLTERKNKEVNFQLKNEQMVHFKSTGQRCVLSRCYQQPCLGHVAMWVDLLAVGTGFFALWSFFS